MDRTWRSATLLALWLAAPLAAAETNPLTDSPTWEELRADVVGDADIAPAAGLFTIEAPYRAEDAATVPIHIVQTDDALAIETATVVIDENPSPVAAEFAFGSAMAPVELSMPSLTLTCLLSKHSIKHSGSKRKFGRSGSNQER